MKNFLIIFSLISLLIAIYFLPTKTILSFIFFFLFWLCTFLLLSTNQYPIWINLSAGVISFLLSLIQLQNIFIAISLALGLFLVLVIREKIYLQKTKKDLKINTTMNAYSDFKTLFKLFVILTIFALVLTSIINENAFAKIFTVSLNLLDNVMANFQIGISSKMTIKDYLALQAKKLQVPNIIEDDFYQLSLETLNQRLNLNLQLETSFRDIIWDQLNQNQYWKISFLLFLSLALLSISSFAILFASIFGAILTKIVILVLIKLKLINKTTVQVEKEILAFK